MGIKVEQLSCADTDILAPAGCVTYSDATSGSITSFNNANGAGEMINNQKFCHCIKYQDGFCDVSLTASNFDLDSGDSLTFGNVVNTGSTFGTSMMLNWNFWPVLRPGGVRRHEHGHERRLLHQLPDAALRLDPARAPQSERGPGGLHQQHLHHNSYFVEPNIFLSERRSVSDVNSCRVANIVCKNLATWRP